MTALAQDNLKSKKSLDPLSSDNMLSQTKVTDPLSSDNMLSKPDKPSPWGFVKDVGLNRTGFIGG